MGIDWESRIQPREDFQSLLRRVALALKDDGLQILRARDGVFEDLPGRRQRFGRVVVFDVGVAFYLGVSAARDVHLDDAVQWKVVQRGERREFPGLLEDRQVRAIEQKPAIGPLGDNREVFEDVEVAKVDNRWRIFGQTKHSGLG